MIGRPRKPADQLTKRITVTIPASVLAAIDAAGPNRSATITRIVAEWMATRSKK